MGAGVECGGEREGGESGECGGGGLTEEGQRFASELWDQLRRSEIFDLVGSGRGKKGVWLRVFGGLQASRLIRLEDSVFMGGEPHYYLHDDHEIFLNCFTFISTNEEKNGLDTLLLMDHRRITKKIIRFCTFF